MKKDRKATVRTNWQLFSEKKTDTVCLDTTRVKLSGLGMFRICIKKSELIFWRSHIKRINFAKTYMKWIVDDWKKVIFSVESYFEIAESKRANTWTKSDDKYNHHDLNAGSTQKHIRVMVWLCIT